MKRVYLTLLVTNLALGLSAHAASRPRYGGSMRIEMRAAIPRLDPHAVAQSAEEDAAREHILPLLFETFVRLDAQAVPQPLLAVAWQHDGDSKRWQFQLRPGVRFHDGTVLTAAAAAQSLAEAVAQTARHWHVQAEADGVVVQSESPVPNMPALLARPEFAITHKDASGNAVGTGEFRIAALPQGQIIKLLAHDAYWGGRPFLDEIEVNGGRPLREQMTDIALGQADLIEVSVDQARRITPEGWRLFTTTTTEALVLVFNAERASTRDMRVREALAFAIDRTAIWSVLLQRQGEHSAALLPQSMSGYAFLFAATPDLERARRLINEAKPPALQLAYDEDDAVAKSVTERIAVNAHEVGMRLETVGGNPTARGSALADATLLRAPFGSLDPATALQHVASFCHAVAPDAMTEAHTPEQLYRAERTLLAGYELIPIAQIPEIHGVNARVKNWREAPAGSWELELSWVWLDATQNKPAPGTGRP